MAWIYQKVELFFVTIYWLFHLYVDGYWQLSYVLQLLLFSSVSQQWVYHVLFVIAWIADHDLLGVTLFQVQKTRGDVLQLLPAWLGRSPLLPLVQLMPFRRPKWHHSPWWQVVKVWQELRAFCEAELWVGTWLETGILIKFMWRASGVRSA